MITKHLNILETLAEGIDPTSGEVLPESHFINHPDCIRAINFAISEVSGEREILKDEIEEIEKDEIIFRLEEHLPFKPLNQACNVSKWTPEEIKNLRITNIENKKPYNNNMPQSEAELKLILKLCKAGLSKSEVAKKIGRREGAITNFLSKISSGQPADNLTSDKPSISSGKKKSTYHSKVWLEASIEQDKFHKNTCGWLRNTSNLNIVKFKKREEAIQLGYEPCNYCKP